MSPFGAKFRGQTAAVPLVRNPATAARKGRGWLMPVFHPYAFKRCMAAPSPPAVAGALLLARAPTAGGRAGAGPRALFERFIGCKPCASRPVGCEPSRGTPRQPRAVRRVPSSAVGRTRHASAAVNRVLRASSQRRASRGAMPVYEPVLARAAGTVDERCLSSAASRVPRALCRPRRAGCWLLYSGVSRGDRRWTLSIGREPSAACFMPATPCVMPATPSRTLGCCVPA
jgi:hypothetical protein